MKKQIMISIIAVTVAFGTIGCGSSSKKIVEDPVINEDPTNNDDSTIDDTPKIVDREIISEFTMPTSNLDTIDYGNGISISQDTQTDDAYITFKHDDKGKRVLFYIDTDNNANTGNSDYKGAELLVSGLQEKSQSNWQLKKQLWKSDDTNQTNWIEDLNGSNDDVFYNSGKTDDSIKLTNGLIQNSYFSVTVEVSENNWTSILTSDKIAFDIGLADSGMPQTINGDSGLSIELDSNATNISMKLIGDEYNEFTKIFIDSDEDNSTGYNPAIWANLGAEYMIKGGKIYHRSADDLDWDYDNVQDVSYVVKDDSINFDFKRSVFNNSNRMIVGVGIYNSDTNWETIHAIPESNVSTSVPSYILN